MSSPGGSPIIRARGLRKVYKTGKVSVEALRGVNLDVPQGEFLSIVGPSGSGKSTLFHIVGGLTPPTSGEVVVGGVDVGAESPATPNSTELRRTLRLVSYFRNSTCSRTSPRATTFAPRFT